jgi:hypothetical protein
MILRFQPTDTPMKLRAEANYERSEASRKIGFGAGAELSAKYHLDLAEQYEREADRRQPFWDQYVTACEGLGEE